MKPKYAFLVASMVMVVSLLVYGYVNGMTLEGALHAYDKPEEDDRFSVGGGGQATFTYAEARVPRTYIISEDKEYVELECVLLLTQHDGIEVSWYDGEYIRIKAEGRENMRDVKECVVEG